MQRQLVYSEVVSPKMLFLALLRMRKTVVRTQTLVVTKKRKSWCRKNWKMVLSKRAKNKRPPRHSNQAREEVVRSLNLRKINKNSNNESESILN